MAKNGKVNVEKIHKAFAQGAVELVGTWEAAEIIGVERPRMGRWIGPWRDWKSGDKEYRESGGASGVPPQVGPEPSIRIPKPVALLKSGPVWLRPEIEQFARERRHREPSAV